jgi:adenosylcobinamide-GDP ribazoletransferase
MSRLRRALSGAQVAVGLLTVVPVRARTEVDGIGHAAAWFPLVGALVGVAVGGVRLGLDRSLGPTLSAVLAVITLVILTGGLHQDGLADVADGLGVRGGRERRLEVMRDSTIGTFGVLALVLWALLLTAALAALPRDQVLKTLVIAGALSRWSAVVHAFELPPARDEGLGAAFAPRWPALLAASALALATLALEPGRVVAALGVALLTTVATSLVAGRVFGGRTGDTLGATIVLTEVVVCIVLVGLAR